MFSCACALELGCGPSGIFPGYDHVLHIACLRAAVARFSATRSILWSVPDRTRYLFVYLALKRLFARPFYVVQTLRAWTWCRGRRGLTPKSAPPSFLQASPADRVGRTTAAAGPRSERRAGRAAERRAPSGDQHTARSGGPPASCLPRFHPPTNGPAAHVPHSACWRVVVTSRGSDNLRNPTTGPLRR